jgi:hypothetical protein
MSSPLPPGFADAVGFKLKVSRGTRDRATGAGRDTAATLA